MFYRKKICNPQYEIVISFLIQSFLFESMNKVIQVKHQEKIMEIHDFHSSFEKTVVLTSFMYA